MFGSRSLKNFPTPQIFYNIKCFTLFNRVNFVGEIIDGDAAALVTKVGPALISSAARIQGPIMSQDSKGEHFKLVKDIHQDIEDFTPLENQHINGVTPKYRD